jgi:hypothetical protein
MAVHNSTAAIRRQARRRYERHLTNPSPWNNCVVNATVPDDIQRVETHVPCWQCGSREACKHRKWMLANG